MPTEDALGSGLQAGNDLSEHSQPGRLPGWLDAQVFSQQAAAGLVLGQSRLALAIERQQAHYSPVSLFLPGV